MEVGLHEYPLGGVVLIVCILRSWRGHGTFYDHVYDVSVFVIDTFEMIDVNVHRNIFGSDSYVPGSTEESARRTR